MKKVSPEEFRREEEEFREIRRRYADWDYIRRQPLRIRAVLEFYVETGDIRLASCLAGLNISAFRNILREANIPVIC